MEALVLKKRIREELQRKDQLVSHNAKEKKAITDADTSGSEKEQKKIEARANTLANEDKPIEDEPVEDVPAHEENPQNTNANGDAPKTPTTPTSKSPPPLKSTKTKRAVNLKFGTAIIKRWYKAFVAYYYP